MKSSKKFLAILLFLFSHSLWAGLYFGPGIGYTRYSNDRLQSHDQVSTGPRYGATVGYNFTPAPVAAEYFYNYSSTKTDELLFNGRKYVYNAKFQTTGIVGKYFIDMFHLRLGYAIHFFDTFMTDFITGVPVTNSVVDYEFGAEGKKTYTGPLFGAGVDIPIGSIVPYIVLTSYQLNSSNSDIFELEGGLKFNF